MGFIDSMSGAMEPTLDFDDDTSPERFVFYDVEDIFVSGSARVSYNKTKDDILVIVGDDQRMISLYFRSKFWRSLLPMINSFIEGTE